MEPHCIEVTDKDPLMSLYNQNQRAIPSNFITKTEKKMEEVLHTSQVQQPVTTINRAFTLIRSIPILALLYYRSANVFFKFINQEPMSITWVLVTVSEFLLSFLWLVHQAFMWRPVTRTVFPERLPGDEELPAVDVFICTADPKKEPVIEVMNTVLSSMALDYPPEKLTVYLSDDGGSSWTLDSIREAWCFAKSWIPFCKKFGIKTRCPEAYFSRFDDENEDRCHGSEEFSVEEEKLKAKYELFKKGVQRAGEHINSTSQDRPSVIQVINDSKVDPMANDDAQTKFPLLVYVAREKRRLHPHHFKAGALNTLLRVSGVISNSPYILVLDCDMYCNDPTSARQAMCFHLDPKINRSLAFVQFPQIFYSISKNDIYDGQMRSAFKTKWQGMDGLRGPLLTGTGFYLKRQALYRSPNQEENVLHELKEVFGTSNEFLASLRHNYITNVTTSNTSLQEARILASCDFEIDTQWGEQIGFLYQCLLESTFTGYYLHCKGWKSVYLYPSRPSFLGCPATNMNDALAQGMKWSSELIRIAVSGFCPLIYGLSRMPILQTMCYTYFMFSPLYAVAITLYAVITQLCLFKGIPLYPKVSNMWFLVFAMAFLGCIGQHLFEVLSSGGSMRTWWNELRIWMVKSVTANLFGYIDAVMKQIGMKKKKELKLTNKVVDKEQLEKYGKGKFDLRGSKVFLIPLVILVISNMVCLSFGLGRIVLSGKPNYDEMFGQIFLSFFVLILSYPIIEGMITRKDSGKI